jgi:hypothetical protein
VRRVTVRNDGPLTPDTIDALIAAIAN